MSTNQVNSDIKLETLYDHYKDTFVYLREYLKFRDKLFVYVLIVLTVMFLLITIPTDTVEAISQIVKEKFKLKISMNSKFIDSMLWFVLLTLVVRYYQASTLIERQYTYIHKVEENLCNIIGEELFYREGKGYLDNYPAFSWWTWFLYTIFFPVLLMIVVSYKLIIEYIAYKKIDINIILDATICIMILISTILYFSLQHSKSIKSILTKIVDLITRIRQSLPF